MKLTRTEARVLALLEAAHGGVTTHQEMIVAMGWWRHGDGYALREAAHATMRQHLYRLRRKGIAIQNLHGRGYRLVRAEVAA